MSVVSHRADTKYDKFLELLNELNLLEKHNQTLVENGFDEWLTVQELTLDILAQIGISPQENYDAEQIIACRNAAASYFVQAPVSSLNEQVQAQEQTKNKQKVQIQENQSQEQTSNDQVPGNPDHTSQRSQPSSAYNSHKENSYTKMNHPNNRSMSSYSSPYYDVNQHSSSAFSKQSGQKVVTPKEEITIQLIKSCQNELKQKENESDVKFIGRLTHVYLGRKGIMNISATPESYVNVFQRLQMLKVLDLQENLIMEMVDMSHLSQLETLNLERNNLTSIEGLTSLQRLRKLYLGYNCLSRIEGLQNCFSLQELNISNQKLEKDQHLEFEEDSLIGISESLYSLEASNCNIKNVDGLQYLRYLYSLDLRNNQIKEVFYMEKALMGMKELRVLDLRGNEVMSSSQDKPRDYLLMMALNVQLFNDKKVLVHEREFLFKFHEIRSKKKGQNSKSQDKKGGMNPNLEIGAQ